jgi:Transposase DDE domain
MNDALIVTIYVVIDETMKTLGHQSHSLAALSDAEVLTVAVVAAHAFGNHHRRALDMLSYLGYLTTRLSPSRFNRRLHALAAWLPLLVETVGACVVQAQAVICDFVIDSLPVPVCRRVRARRCGKVRGRAYCGYCAAKQEKFFGWRLHLVCTTDGVPVASVLLPASYHDLTPIHEVLYGLPPGAYVYADKAYNSADDEASILAATGVHLVPLRKDNMVPNTWAERCGLRAFRTTIETVNSQCEAMGLQRLRARTNAGFELKVQASVLALACANLD